MVPPDSQRISRARCYLGSRPERDDRFRLRDCHPLWCAFPDASSNATLCHSPPRRQPRQDGPTTPTMKHLPALTHDRFSLFRFRSPLLTESRLLSLPEGNEMFHFPSFPPHALCVQARVAEFCSAGFPHSEILESQLGCQLLEAYRRLLRPSSAPGAKASTVCP